MAASQENGVSIFETRTTVTFLNSKRKKNLMVGSQSKSQSPRPGQRVRGSTTGRPVMAALDLLGRRWALRLMWELRQSPAGARALRERCDGMSSSVMYERLAELRDSGLIQKNADGHYELTNIGTDLGAALAPLDEWAKEWQRSS